MLAQSGNGTFHKHGVEAYAEALAVGELYAVTRVRSETLFHFVVSFLVGICFCNAHEHIAAHHYSGYSHRILVIVGIIDRNPALRILGSFGITLGRRRQQVGIAGKTEGFPFHCSPIYAVRLGAEVFFGKIAIVQKLAAYSVGSTEIHRNHGILPGQFTLRYFRVVIPVTFPDYLIIQGMVEHGDSHCFKQRQIVIIAWEQTHIMVGRRKADYICLSRIE